MKNLIVLLFVFIVSCSKTQINGQATFFGFINNTNKKVSGNYFNGNRWVNFEIPPKSNLDLWSGAPPELLDSLTLGKITKINFINEENKIISFECSNTIRFCDSISNPLNFVNYKLFTKRIKKNVEWEYYYYEITENIF